MKQGDLVIKKNAWKWIKHNPWMKGEGMFDDRIGIIINPCTKTCLNKMPVSCAVMWSDGKINNNFRVNRLQVIND